MITFVTDATQGVETRAKLSHLMHRVRRAELLQLRGPPGEHLAGLPLPLQDGLGPGGVRWTWAAMQKVPDV